MKNKKSMVDIINLITGLLLIMGGVLVISNYVNLGLLLAIIGTLFKALEIVIKTGIK